MYKFKIKLLYNEKIFSCTKTELLNFKITLRLAKLGMAGSRLVSNGLILQMIFRSISSKQLFYCNLMLGN